MVVSRYLNGFLYSLLSICAIEVNIVIMWTIPLRGVPMKFELVCDDNLHSKATFELEKLWILSRYKVNRQPSPINVIFLLDWHFWVHSLYYKEEWGQRKNMAFYWGWASHRSTTLYWPLRLAYSLCFWVFRNSWLKIRLNPSESNYRTWQGGLGIMIKALLHSLLHWL